MINFNMFSAFALLTSLGCFYVSGITIFFGKEKLHRIWALFNLAIAGWSFFVFLATLTKSPQLSYSFWIIAHGIGIFIPALFLHSITIFCNITQYRLLKIAYIYSVILTAINSLGYQYKGVVFLFNSFYYLDAHPHIFLSLMSFWFILAFWGNYKLYCSYSNQSRISKNIILIAASLGFIGGSSTFLPMLGIPYYPVTIILIAFYAIAISYAIFRHQFLDIRFIIQKSLVYSILITSLTLLYLTLIYLSERVFQATFGYNSLITSTTIVLLIAILFTPLKNKIQYFVDHYFFKGSQAEIAHENELLRQEVAQTERLKAVSTLARGIAHEVKNPLTAIKTFSEYLPEKKQDPEFLDKFSRIVGNEVNRIDQLVNQLLDFAKPSPLKLEAINIHQLIDDTLELLNSKFIKQKIKLIKNYRADTFLSINADPNQLKQAFLNILLNAIDAMENGGTLTVETSNPNAGAIEIHFRDTGCGIPKKDIPHLFDPFFSKKDKGTGLGLSITHGIITEHKGNIQVESMAGAGTDFTINLPA